MTIIERVAEEYGVSPDECRTAIQELIDQSWATTDPVIKDRQIRLVGEGRTPSPEELIILVANLL